jgi:hypothetical protein
MVQADREKAVSLFHFVIFLSHLIEWCKSQVSNSFHGGQCLHIFMPPLYFIDQLRSLIS